MAAASACSSRRRSWRPAACSGRPATLHAVSAALRSWPCALIWPLNSSSGSRTSSRRQTQNSGRRGTTHRRRRRGSHRRGSHRPRGTQLLLERHQHQRRQRRAHRPRGTQLLLEGRQHQRRQRRVWTGPMVIAVVAHPRPRALREHIMMIAGAIAAHALRTYAYVRDVLLAATTAIMAVRLVRSMALTCGRFPWKRFSMRSDGGALSARRPRRRCS